MTVHMTTELAAGKAEEQVYIERFLAKCELPDGTPLLGEDGKIRDFLACWLWLGGRGVDPYGRFPYRGESEKVNRMSYRLFVGDLEDEQVNHTCHVKCCGNPLHVYAGSGAQNSADGFLAGRLHGRNSTTRVGQ